MGPFKVAGCMSFALVLALSPGCRRHGSTDGNAKDTYKSPYIPVARDAGHAPPAEPKVAPEPVSRFHPASRGVDYPLRPVDEIAASAADRELLVSLGDPKQGVKVLKAVRKKGSSGLKLMRSALRANNDSVRKQSCMILANLRDRSSSAIKALTEAVLYDPEPEVRATAAKSFVALKSSKAAPALIRSLLEDPWAPARANAAQALGNTGGKGAVNALVKALKDPDTWVRLRSVSALKKRRARNTIKDLADLLDDPNRMVRARTRDVLKSLSGVDRGGEPSDWK